MWHTTEGRELLHHHKKVLKISYVDVGWIKIVQDEGSAVGCCELDS